MHCQVGNKNWLKKIIIKINRVKSFKKFCWIKNFSRDKIKIKDLKNL